MYGGGYGGDPRGRAGAVEARQGGRDDFSFEDRRAARRDHYLGDRDKGPRGGTIEPLELMTENPQQPRSPIQGVNLDKLRQEQEQGQQASMGGGPSYDTMGPPTGTLGTAPISSREWEPDNNPLTESWQSSEQQREIEKRRALSGVDTLRWSPEIAKDPYKRAKFQFEEGWTQPFGWMAKAKQAVWDKTSDVLNSLPHSIQDQILRKGGDAGYASFEDMVRHGIAANTHGLIGATAYEIFKSGGEVSDYTNNLEAIRFAKTLTAGEDFDSAWALAVAQERLNPGSTGLNLDFKAGTEDDPTGHLKGLANTAGTLGKDWMASILGNQTELQKKQAEHWYNVAGVPNISLGMINQGWGNETADF